ncbi:MAG TPA: aminodeoxychorismate synthase component I [Noviherbaspirillum sp.]|uniref:aminodeoxychorismate synthase component I n=1 Tax=Noviherbaspirillum sp. TaxID=1926288 RepID=UPI002DDCD810|nr:aminodeoxychorismate synthase component I [Noviherbaspirillum sp.]HEV2611134.1 aminodeoxychorismate synthase component I [Noviherbaspirillum sp.]
MHATDCFALLDDSSATNTQPRSRLYTGYAGTLSCPHPDQLPALWDGLQKALNEGRHAVGLFSYELGAAMHSIAPHADAACSRIVLFDRCQHLSAADAESALAERARRAASPFAGILNIRPNVSQAEFTAAIDRIRAYIEAGDTYQVNYTYRLNFQSHGDPVVLYRRLRERQPVPYGALIVLPDGGAVLSLSPELFLRHGSGELTARPMKGTAAATGNPDEDAARAAALAADPKNRAENLMIVDLLRNDLGRIAAPGSVKVPDLFSTHRYSGVLQMTSTVRARLRDDTVLADVFAAVYPCGSITGAPKRRTMQIIGELERAPRGYYTGAIGWFDAPPPGRAVGDFCLSVPIRTLVLQPEGADGLRSGEMGVGAGIVHDSVAADEYAECALKAAFLAGLSQEFALFETMHATREAGCRHLERHLRRLAASASHFNIPFDRAAVHSELEKACGALPDGPHRLRLAIGRDGGIAIQTAPLSPLEAPVKVLLAREPTMSADPWLRHKTTLRERYDAGWRAAESVGAFDTLFCNEHGELTEGGRSNLFIRRRGRWITPPLSAGVLPGVMRSVLLDDPRWDAREGRLTLDDLRGAEEVVVCNALRGALPAVIDWNQAATFGAAAG